MAPRLDRVDFYLHNRGRKNRHGVIRVTDDRSKDDMPSKPAECLTKTKILKEDWEVKARLEQLELSRETLLRIASIALNEGRNATPYHAANAAGTLSYQHGTFGLRNEIVGERWKVDRPHQIEAIYNEELKIRVVFSNVDLACNDDHLPKPRSAKGSGSEQASVGNLFGDNLPHYSRLEAHKIKTFYLMLDEAGACELSVPIVKDGTFISYVERIYIGNAGGNDLEAERLPLDSNDSAKEFDPKVVRK
jgi:hypothetical protein